VKSFPGIAPSIGQLQVSSDGTELFAVDTTNYKIIAVNARSGQILKSYALASPISSDFSFAYARPAGVPTLFAPGQAAIDVSTGNQVSFPLTGGFFYDPFITATPDGSHLAIVERGLEPGSLYSYTVISDNGHLTITQINGSRLAGSNCPDVAISPDGSRLYPACGAPYEFDVYDFASLKQIQTLAATNYPNNAEFDSDGDFVGGVDGTSAAADIFVYDASGYNLGTIPLIEYEQGQQNGLMKISGDSTRVISGTWSPSAQILFREMPHP
jgi:WD40 repeat protein